MKKFISITLLAFLYLDLFANAGAFGGFGNNIKLVDDKNIQMRSEDIRVKLVQAKAPVTGNLKYMDEAHYDCQFKMRNLSDKEVSVKMGFPLSGIDNFMARGKNNKIESHQFKVYINGKELNATHEKITEDKKFRNIFVWEANFAPNEEKDLRVTYRTFGYTGLGELTKRPRDYNLYMKFPKFLQALDTCILQHYEYVTLTGNSWKGQIENAKFSIDVGDFEKYLNERGYMAEDKNSKKAKIKKSKKKNVLDCLRNGILYRHVSPDTWKLSADAKTLEIEYAPFTPKENITISYYFTLFPKDLPALQELMSALELKEVSDKKLFADAILEFYGIPINNEALKSYLSQQIWYPVKNQMKIDEALKSELLKLSKAQ